MDFLGEAQGSCSLLSNIAHTLCNGTWDDLHPRAAAIISMTGYDINFRSEKELK